MYAHIQYLQFGVLYMWPTVVIKFCDEGPHIYNFTRC